MICSVSFIEYMNLFNIESELNMISRSGGGTRIYSRGDRELCQIEVQEYFCAEQLVYSDGGLKYALRRLK